MFPRELSRSVHFCSALFCEGHHVVLDLQLIIESLIFLEDLLFFVLFILVSTIWVEYTPDCYRRKIRPPS